MHCICRDRRDREKDDVSRMPKAKDEQAPVSGGFFLLILITIIINNFFLFQNFVASNKYSMLPDDVDPDNIDD